MCYRRRRIAFLRISARRSSAATDVNIASWRSVIARTSLRL